MSINALKADLINRFHLSPEQADKMIRQARARASVKHAVASAGKLAVAKDSIDYAENPGAWREEVQKRMQAIEIMEDGVKALDKLGKILKRIIQAEEKMIGSKTAQVNNKDQGWWDFQESGWAMGGREMFAQALCDILCSLDESKLAATIVDRIGFKRTIPIPENDVAPLVPSDPKVKEAVEDAPEPSPSASPDAIPDDAKGVEASIIRAVKASAPVKAAPLPMQNALKRFMVDLNKLEWTQNDAGESFADLDKAQLMKLLQKYDMAHLPLPAEGAEKTLGPGLTLYNGGAGKFNLFVGARFVAARTARAAWTVDPKAEKSARDKANADLNKLITNKYFTGVPVKEVAEILSKHGFDPEAMDGIYTGRQGKMHEQVGPKTWISLTWYKMEESGRYEIVTYLS